jgi:hypothetical protein
MDPADVVRVVHLVSVLGTQLGNPLVESGEVASAGQLEFLALRFGQLTDAINGVYRHRNFGIGVDACGAAAAIDPLIELGIVQLKAVFYEYLGAVSGAGKSQSCD